MRVSVVIPAYKAAGTICRTIDSVLAQTHPAHEIIVVDDGSPDDQVEVIRQAYADRVLVIRQPNGKTAKARNAGIDRATGDAVAFLDADDYWEAEKLEKQLAILRRFPEVGLVAGTWFSETPGEGRTAPPTHSLRRVDYDQVLRVRKAEIVRIAAVTWTGMVLIRREALGDERFVSGLEPAEDRDLWIRMLRHPAYLLLEPLATAVLEPGSISRTNLDVDCEKMMRVIQRNRGVLGFAGYRLWRSYTLFRWSAMDPVQAPSLRRLAYSWLMWPFPYQPYLPAARLVRAKRLAVLFRKLLQSRTTLLKNGGA
jgi:glycosyltransferase involved in cell wall biosynthesis